MRFLALALTLALELSTPLVLLPTDALASPLPLPATEMETALQLEKRIVVNPPITYPDNTTVWYTGQKGVNATWWVVGTELVHAAVLCPPRLRLRLQPQSSLAPLLEVWPSSLALPLDGSEEDERRYWFSPYILTCIIRYLFPLPTPIHRDVPSYAAGYKGRLLLGYLDPNDTTGNEHLRRESDGGGGGGGVRVCRLGKE